MMDQKKGITNASYLRLANFEEVSCNAQALDLKGVFSGGIFNER